MYTKRFNIFHGPRAPLVGDARRWTNHTVEIKLEDQTTMFTIFGLLCFGFAIIDYAVSFVGYDLTGVSWSPIAAGVIGSILISIGGDDN